MYQRTTCQMRTHQGAYVPKVYVRKAKAKVKYLQLLDCITHLQFVRHLFTAGSNCVKLIQKVNYLLKSKQVTPVEATKSNLKTRTAQDKVGHLYLV